MCRSHICITVLRVFGKHVVFVYMILLVCVCASSSSSLYSFLEHKPIWRDRCIDLLRSYSNQMHELDFECCFSLSSHSNLPRCMQLSFNQSFLLYCCCVCACVCECVCVQLTIANKLPPVAEIFADPFMPFCTTQFGSCLNFSLLLLLLFWNSFSFRLTLLPITNGWHKFVFCLRIEFVYDSNRVLTAVSDYNKFALKKIIIKEMVMETRKS